MDDLRKTQESFARKAQAQPTHEFRDLYHLVCREDWLREALQAVLCNVGSRTAGVDGISRKQLAEEAAQARLIDNLRAELKTGTWGCRMAKAKWYSYTR
jgi:RNA-directed DNA polymerase